MKVSLIGLKMCKMFKLVISSLVISEDEVEIVEIINNVYDVMFF